MTSAKRSGSQRFVYHTDPGETAIIVLPVKSFFSMNRATASLSFSPGYSSGAVAFPFHPRGFNNSRLRSTSCRPTLYRTRFVNNGNPALRSNPIRFGIRAIETSNALLIDRCGTRARSIFSFRIRRTDLRKDRRPFSLPLLSYIHTRSIRALFSSKTAASGLTRKYNCDSGINFFTACTSGVTSTTSPAKAV